MKATRRPPEPPSRFRLKIRDVDLEFPVPLHRLTFVLILPPLITLIIRYLK